MVFHINSRLLNSLGLLSAGVLLANPHLVNAQMGAPNANSLIAQNTAAPVVPIPAVPGTPKLPTMPSIPAVPSSPMPKVMDPMAKPADTLKPEAAVRNTTIVDIASSNGSFKTLTAALKAAGLTEALSGEGPFTVFAPTDEAFAALPKGVVEALLKPENKPLLVKILTYHVVPGKVMAADLKSGQVNSLEGSAIVVKLSTADTMPPKATSDKPLDKSADKPSDKAPVDKAPVDKAPAAVPKAMTDPKVSDLAAPNMPPKATTTITVNQAKVKIADVAASNGVIHAIDQVILPPDVVAQLSKALDSGKPAATKPAATKPAAKPATKPSVAPKPGAVKPVTPKP
jgi:uncharacterized surface protein with fasciclin (FAS1) repeats